MGYFLQILEEREEQPQKVLEKDPVGSKVLERNVCVSSSEIKAEKEQPDHEVNLKKYSQILFFALYFIKYNLHIYAPIKKETSGLCTWYQASYYIF